MHADEHILYHIFNVSGMLKDKCLSVPTSLSDSMQGICFLHTSLNPRHTNELLSLLQLSKNTHTHSLYCLK